MALLAILMPVMIGVAAFAINVVYMEMTRTELQISLDLATRAAGRTLAVTEDQAQATAAANLMLQQNPYANQVLSLADTNISFGVSTRNSSSERYAFESGVYPNAVKIETNGNNDVPLLFPTMGLDIPLRPIKTSICTSMEMDVALVLDRSGSMAFAANESSGGGYPMNAPPGVVIWRSRPTAITLARCSGRRRELHFCLAVITARRTSHSDDLRIDGRTRRQLDG